MLGIYEEPKRESRLISGIVLGLEIAAAPRSFGGGNKSWNWWIHGKVEFSLQAPAGEGSFGSAGTTVSDSD